MQLAICLCIVIGVVLPAVNGFSCPRWSGVCEDIVARGCPELSSCPAADKYDDGCACCPVCKKQRAERCEGQYAGAPSCGAGLRCHKSALKPYELSYNQDGICIQEGDDPAQLWRSMLEAEGREIELSLASE